MEASFSSGRIRKDFSKIERIIDIPNLIDIQNRSFERFLQADVAPEKREPVGLQAVFHSVFPIRDFNETASLEFVSYTLEKPKYDVAGVPAARHDLRRADQGHDPLDRLGQPR